MPASLRSGRPVHVIPAEAFHDEALTEDFTALKPIAAQLLWTFAPRRQANMLTAVGSGFPRHAVVQGPLPRGNRGLDSRCARAVTSCLVITAPARLPRYR